MTWDGATGTVTAVKPDVSYTAFQGNTKQGDLTVELTIGSNDITYWYEGNTTADPHGHQAQVVEHIQSEVAPYVYQNRTYIPLRPAGRCAELQCRLGRRGGSGHHR